MVELKETQRKLQEKCDPNAVLGVVGVLDDVQYVCNVYLNLYT